MKLTAKRKQLFEINRVLIILLIAFCIVEGFFLWLVLFPNAENNVPTDYDTEQEAISDEREVDVTEFLERQKYLAKWDQFEAELQERYGKSEDSQGRYEVKGYAIAFASLNDPELTLQVNADQDFIAASTYKLFAAYSMFQSGNPPSCLDTMIIHSDNDCPVDWLNSYGWSRFTEDAHAIGAENSRFGDTTHTTANDLVGFLKQIYNGTLLSAEDNNRLITDMKEQVFRDGIPTGIPEAEVADKVGFLDGLLHDAGIVYSPKGDFILVILTDGYSWESIAETATEIYSHL